MENKNINKKNFYFSFKKVKKIWLPIILTILIILNVPFIPNSVGTNDNINLQPFSTSGEAIFFPPSYFNQKNTKNGKGNGGNAALLVFFLIICIIIGIVYYVFYKLKNTDEQKEEDRTDYMELLKDDSDYEGNI